MNKSPQYNQQTEPKQCKSDVEKISLMHLPKPGKWPSHTTSTSRKNPKEKYLKIVTSRSVMLHSAKSALLFTTMQPR